MKTREECVVGKFYRVVIPKGRCCDTPTGTIVKVVNLIPRMTPMHYHLVVTRIINSPQIGLANNDYWKVNYEFLEEQ